MPLRLIVLCVVCSAVVLAGGAGPAEAWCSPKGHHPRLDVFTAHDGASEVKVIACDRRTGRSKLLAVARARWPKHARHGALVLGAWPSAVGLRVWWIEARVNRRRMLVQLATADYRRPHVVRRRVLLLTRRPRPFTSAQLGVAMFRGGTFAWLEPAAGRTVLRLRRPNGSDRVVAHGDFFDVGIDDGFTLRWTLGDWSVHYRDVVAPPRRVGGCPVRAAYKTIVATSDVKVSEQSGGQDLIRICRRSTGRDPVYVPPSDGTEDDSDAPEGGKAETFVAGTGPWLLGRVDLWDRYEYCLGSGVFVLDVRTMKRSRVVPPGAVCDLGDVPDSAKVAAVSAAGVPVWIGTSQHIDTAYVRTATPDGRAVDLDMAPAGTLTDLQVQGERATWLHDGTPRSAPLS